MKKLPKLAAAAGVAVAVLSAQEASASHCPIYDICRHCQSCQSDPDGGVTCWFEMDGGGYYSACWEKVEYDENTGEIIYEWCEGEFGCNAAE